MRPEANFVAERLAAQHCQELLRSSRQQANPLVEIARFGERFAELLGEQLGQLCPGLEAGIVPGEAAEIQANSPNERRGEPMLNSMVAAGPREAMLIASLPLKAMIALVDIALGGKGKDCEVHGGKLPLSAQLTHNRFEKLLTAALAKALELPGVDSVRLKNPGAAPEANAPFAGCKRTILPIQLTIGECEPCEMVLTFPGMTVTALFANRGKPAAPAAGTAQATLHSQPFAAIPLPLKAILVDMAVPVSTLAKLKPGTVIPVAVARSVPLIAGDQVIAHGTVGSMDDNTALQLTRISSAKEN